MMSSGVVSGIQSNAPIALAVASDDRGVHLAIVQDSGVFYVKGAVQGNDIVWLKPSRIADPADVSSPVDIEIAVTPSRIHVFWADGRLHYRASDDGGVTWRRVEGDTIKTELLIDAVAVHTVSETIHMVLSGGESGVLYQRSRDGGVRWDKAVALDVRQAHSVQTSALFASGHKVYAVWADYDTSRQPVGSLFFRVSNDGGSEWSEPDLISRQADIVSDLAVAALGNRVVIVWHGGGFGKLPAGLYWQQGSGKSADWTAPTVLTRGRPEAASQERVKLIVSRNERLLALWVDKRHVRREWWARIPLHEFITWDMDPEWSNNDLYVRPLDQTGWLAEVRLTPTLAYVWTLDGVADESTYVFWSGKEKVGRRLAESRDPYQVFWMKLDYSSGR